MARSSAHRINTNCVLYHSTVGRPGDRPRGIRKVASTSARTSERLQRRSQRLAVGKQQDAFSSKKIERVQEHPEVGPAQVTNRKRKLRETQPPSHKVLEPARKRERSTPDDVAPRETANCSDPIEYWRKHGYCWPKELFYLDPKMNHTLARKKSSSSLRRRAPGTESTTTAQSDPIQYQDPLYKQSLAEKGVYMDDYDVVEGSEELFSSLFRMEQTVPENSRFSDKLFKYTLRNIQDKNEARVVRDISLLIVPSPEDLAAEYLATGSGVDLTCLIESTNEPWSASVKIEGPKPKPDHSVGFRREAFTSEQLQRLQPFVGDRKEESFFRATYLMYFPFLTSEVKCGAAALDVADRQNAHSMAVGVRGVVELFRLVNREQELHRTILGFSISHDHRTVRIYGYYASTKERITYHRQQIDTFDFTALNGKRRWKTYKFVKNIYERWMPEHFRRICSAIDQIPLGINFAASQPSDLRLSEQTALAQEAASYEMVASVESTESETGQSSIAEPRVVTPSTSVSQEGSKPRQKRKHKSSISVVEQ